MNSETKPTIEAEISLKRLFLRAALSISGSSQSSPEATRVAGMEAAKLKSEIARLENDLAHAA